MKICTIVGARPQFIKVAAVSRVLRKEHEEILIHTGQHYDYNMSDIFFEELSIPKPDYNLGIAGGTHGQMTGDMIKEIEKVLMKEEPDLVLVYGDTNSTLAGALASVKLHIPVCHVESGGRLGTLNNPEEVNRIVTDHISTLLMCCTKSAVEFLKKEGKNDNVHLVGDPMFDSFEYYSNLLGDKISEELLSFDGIQVDKPENFYYLTCHREENTNDDSALLEILNAMDSLDYPCIYPVHPRNQERVHRLQESYHLKNIMFCRPVGYLTSIFLVKHAKKIITDSGGLQREAFFAKKQCVTVFDYIAWPETMVGNCNQLSKPIGEEILEKLNTRIDETEFNNGAFGDGHAAEKIVNTISDYANL